MSKKKEVYGSIRFSYDTLAMPLEVAHKVQALLAEHAVKIDEVYCGGRNPNFSVTRDWDMSAVEIAMTPKFHCEGMDNRTYSEWKTIVGDRESGAPIMDPKTFESLKREEQ